MRIFILLLLPLCLLFPCAAQSLKGKIVDKEGEPVPNATVFIRELSQGIAADDRGEFQTALPAGNYMLEVSSLGYEKKILPVVGQVSASMFVQLEAKVYSLQGVTVSNKEDPAYAVMRKAIAKAPYYLRQVKSSQSEVYIKESFKVGKVPALIGRMKVDETGKRVKDYAGKLYMEEIQEEIKFTSPDKYEVKTIAYSSSLPKDLTDGGDAGSVITESIYAPKIISCISPLAPDAFSYYKFRFEGISQEGDLWVNKIQVIPRKKNMQLAAGWLYIAEGTWHVMNVDLTGSMLGITRHIKVNYNEVKPSVFLPTAYDITMDIDVMGLKIDVKHYSSVRYSQVELDGSLGASAHLLASQPEPPATIAPKAPSPKQEKARKQLETLAAKENFSNRDAYKMAKLMKDAVEPEDTTRNRDEFEIKPITRDVKVTLDSLAKQRDSLYWASVRDLPLRDEERLSYQREEADGQTTSRKDTTGARTVTVSASAKGPWEPILLGREVKLGKKVRMTYGGLRGVVPEYNFVDGFWLGQRLTFDFSGAEKGRGLKLSPSAYYVTARQTVNWKMDAAYRYAPMRNGELTLSGGNTTADFNRGKTANSRLINSIASLFFAENMIKFYQKQFVEAGNSIDLANGLILGTGLTYEKRYSLENRTSFRFFGKRPASNLPHALWFPEPVHTATLATLQLSYTPRLYYRKEDERKRYVKSDYPTFVVRYEKGIPVGGGKTASFDRLEVAVIQQVRMNVFDKLNYMVNAGTFLSSKHVYFPDYKHFPTNQLPVTAQSLYNSFSLLSDYNNSTTGDWLQAHAAYTSSYLLVKHLPFLQNYLFDEAIHFRSLWTSHREYFELGYSAGLGDIMRAGVFVGSNRFRYLAVGITVSIPLLSN